MDSNTTGRLDPLQNGSPQSLDNPVVPRLAPVEHSRTTSPPPSSGVFEPFNKNRLEWAAFDRLKSRDTDQAIRDKLKGLISKIDESGIIGCDKTEDARPRDMESMPMNRTFLFQKDVDPRFPRLDDLVMLYRMEQGLSKNMLTMLNDGTSQEFSESIGRSLGETEEQKFRRQAINRCALRQALTESTDATARSCNLVKLVVEPYETEAEVDALDPFPEELQEILWDEDLTRSRWTSRRDVEANDTLESFFSICQEPNELEIDLLSHSLRVEQQSVRDWFRGKQKRVNHLFVARRMPQGNSVRMLDHRMRQSLHDIFPPRLDTS